MAEKMNILNKLYQEYIVKKIKETNWEKGSTAPLVVEFDTTEVCNLACPGCISEDLVNNKTSFSNERLMTLANELYEAGVKAVILIGGGEPLAHPKVGEFIKFLSEHDIHIGITTNGYFIDRYMDTIAKYSKWTRVSMDAATAETFNELRPGKDGKCKFEKIINNMKELAKRKEGKLGFSFLVRTEADGFGIRSNIHEIYAAAQLAKQIGCDYFEVKPSYRYIGGQPHALVVHSKERMQEARKEINKLDSLETETFKIIKAITLEDSLNQAKNIQIKKYTTCPIAQLRTLITPSGVYVCPYWRGKENYRIGNAHEESFEQIWTGEQRAKIMKRLNPSIECQFHCLRDESNKEIFKMMDMEEINVIDEYDRFL